MAILVCVPSVFLPSATASREAHHTRVERGRSRRFSRGTTSVQSGEAALHARHTMGLTSSKRMRPGRTADTVRWSDIPRRRAPARPIESPPRSGWREEGSLRWKCSELRLPAVAEYVTAFRAIKPGDHRRTSTRCYASTTPRRRAPCPPLAWLKLLASRTTTASISSTACWPRRSLAELALDLAGHVQVGVLVEFVDPGHAANEHWLWVMRPNVAQALEDLGWVPRVSHLLYPDLALEALRDEVTVRVFDATQAMMRTRGSGSGTTEPGRLLRQLEVRSGPDAAQGVLPSSGPRRRGQCHQLHQGLLIEPERSEDLGRAAGPPRADALQGLFTDHLTKEWASRGTHAARPHSSRLAGEQTDQSSE